MQAFGFYCSVLIRAFKASFPPVYPGAHREGPWALGVIQFKCMQFKCVLQIADSCYWEAHWLPSDDTWWILIVFKHFSSIFIKRSRLQNPSKRLQNPSKRLQKPSNAYKSQKVGQMGFFRNLEKRGLFSVASSKIKSRTGMTTMPSCPCVTDFPTGPKFDGFRTNATL